MSLALVGVVLGALGLADLVRSAGDITTRRRRLVCGAVGSTTVLVGVTIVSPEVGWAMVWWVVLTCIVIGWVWTSADAIDPGRAAAARATSRSLALGILGVGLLTAALAAQSVDSTVVDLDLLDRTVLGRWAPSTVLIVLGVSLAELATANVVVRLVLDAVGVPATSNEKKLKGGRLLGPMERLFILGLAGSGAVTAAAVVVAAKGLLRFPELQNAHASGPSDVTEYFLIGSFVSWLLAFGGVGLVVLG